MIDDFVLWEVLCLILNLNINKEGNHHREVPFPFVNLYTLKVTSMLQWFPTFFESLHWPVPGMQLPVPGNYS